MDNIVSSRSEIIFLYDVKDANPNGDPLDENKPRIDEETGINIVTDVRLKRTIRDYLQSKDKKIFVKEIIYDEDGHIQDAKMRAGDFGNDRKRILEECIDIRLFGGVLPIIKSKKEKAKKDNGTESNAGKYTESKEDKGAITYTGPVQFKMGRSLHRVTTKHIRGTGAFASDPKATHKTFREEDFLPYSLIRFYGIINENAAKLTGLTDEDVQLLLDGIWNGTKSLITRTKIGQVPRLLLKVNYRKKNYHIGDLDEMLTLETELPHENIRDVSDYQIDVSKLVEKLIKEKETIQNIEVCVDDRIRFCRDGVAFSMADLKTATDIDVKLISF
ncbi:MAG: type I-B CRISPR-associated protein Cas7/Csh2 [Methanothrix sp.]|uniref:type I-B CRISPR-associated protein Cas7/Csh2 n=1 Tax=Methanothrix sp. TaxID=90426 RepID=UPI001B523E09|nr:type I-B CRISPR-associated protein Cas7/Csh2 [Methanothrix sp.]MBP7067746.1 type I-B CRISPR-associated protein Cas7/Csh2 [Methanothrix sp.]